MFFIFSSILFSNNIAQTLQCKATYNWIFGTNAGVTFMGSAQPSPSAITTSAMNMTEGCASISDENGNLLFYTDGINVWDASNTITPNGTGLAGGGISAQSSIIVPLPQNDSIYYIFTVKDWTTAQNGIGFNYSILNVNLPGNGTSANPLGDIDVNNKNIPIDSNVREQVTAIYHENCQDIWIVTHRGSKWHSSDKYLAYLLTPTGLNTTPIISSVGMTYYTSNRFGYLKPSHNGKKICTTLGRGANGSNFNGTTVELLDFSNSTGVVSNPIVIADNGSTVNAYSSEFSPDNNILYVVGFDGNFIDQYDLSSGIQSTIVASKTNVASGNAVKSCLQLGPDNKIYVARNGTNYLGVINDPNSLVNSNYIDQAVNLGSGSAKLGLPTFWKRQNAQIFSNVAICQGDSIFVGGAYQNTAGTYNDTTYGTSVCAGCDSILTTNLIINTPVTSSTNLTICDNQLPYSWNGLTFNATGSQSVTLTSSLACDSIATLNLTVNPSVTNTTNISICDNQLPYSWNGLTFNAAGSQSITLTNAFGCDSIETLNLIVNPILTNTTNLSICDNQLPYTWNGLTFNAAGSQSDTLSNAFGCDSIETLNLTVNALPVVDAGLDTTICDGDTVNLMVDSSFIFGPPVEQFTMTFDTAFSYSTINTNLTGNYYAVVSGTYSGNGPCELRDGAFWFYQGCQNITPISAFPWMWNGANPNTQATVPTTYNPNHEYYFYFTGGASQTFSFVEQQVAWYNDNFGSLSFEIYYLGNISWSNGVTTSANPVNPSQTTTYVVTGLSGSGCVATDTVMVFVNPTPNVTVLDQTICEGDTASLIALPDMAGGVYFWTPGGATTDTIFVSPFTTTNYSLDYSINGCSSSTANALLTVNPIPTADAGVDDTICEGDSFLLMANGPDQYIWNDSIPNNSYINYPIGSYSFVLEASINNCMNLDTMILDVLERPVSIIGSNVIEGYSVLLVDFTNSSSIVNSYEWNFDNGTTTIVNDQSPQSISFVDVGDYFVSLIASNGFCKDTSWLKITVLPYSVPSVFVPNVFSPNNDNVNDELQLTYENILEFNFNVYNRWGNLVYATKEVSDFWDGNIDGKEAKEGVYFYTYKGLGLNNAELSGNGFLTLLR